MAKPQPFETIVKHLFQIATRAEFKTLNDQELLKRYVENRDGLALGELVRRYKGMLWCVCWRVLRHHQDVEDAFQATIMTLVRRAKAIVGHASIEGWLHSTAFKVACTARRNRNHRHAREERNATMHRESYERQNYGWEIEEVLDKELTHIPEKLRSPLILCYLEGLTQEEAAQRLGITIDSLDWRLRQGRERLKRQLGNYGLDLGHMMPMAKLAGGVQIPEVPHDLVERTLDMVRIATLSYGSMEAAGFSPQVATLVHGAMGLWTLKLKICFGVLLLTLAGAGAGVAKYPNFFLNLLGWEQSKETRPNTPRKVADGSRANKAPVRTDLYGDPLPPGAITRLGTERFRPCYGGLDHHKEVLFTSDNKGLLTVGGRFPCLWDRETGKLICQLINPVRNGTDMSRVKFSPDRKLRSGVKDPWYADKDQSSLFIWNTVSGTAVHELKFQGNKTRVENNKEVKIPCAVLHRNWAIAPDNQSVVVAYVWGGHVHIKPSNGHLVLWDIATGQKRWELKEEKRGKRGIRLVQSLAISPDGGLVADGGYRMKEGGKHGDSIDEQNIILRDARTGKALRTLGHSWRLNSLSFSPDGRILLAYYAESSHGGNSNSIYAFNIATGKELWKLEEKNHSYQSPIISPDSKILVVISNDKFVLVETATGNKVLEIQGEGEGPLDLSADGKLLARICDPTIRFWDTATGKRLPPLPMLGHESGVNFAAFTADGTTLISRGNKQEVYVWDSLTAQKKRSLLDESTLRRARSPGDLWEIVGAAVSLDGKVVAGVCLEVPKDKKFDWSWNSIRTSVRLWGATGERELRKIPLNNLPGAGKIPTKIVLSPDSKFLAVCLARSSEHRVFLWEIATGNRLNLKIEGSDPVFSSDGMLLMTQKEGMFSLWDMTTHQKVFSAKAPKKLERNGQAIPIAVSLNWQSLALDTEENNRMKIDVYPLYKDHRSIRFGLPQSVVCSPSPTVSFVRSLTLSPDGRMLAWEGENYRQDHITIHVCETATGQERCSFNGHKGRIRFLSFSPDGRRLASGSEDTTILIWDVTQGQLGDRGHLRPLRLSVQQIEQLWADLGKTDSPQGPGAIWTLAAAPSATVPFLAKHLSPIAVDPALAQRIARLITELDDDKFPVRKKAMAELEKLGGAAESSLRQALTKELPVEVRRRLQQLLAAIETKQQVPPKEEIRVLRAIEILEQIGNREAQQLLKQLSQGAPGIRQTEEARASLQRLQQQAARQRVIRTH